MSNTLYFDLDGVLRDLECAIWGEPQQTWLKGKDDKSVYEYVTANPHLLTEAQPDGYWKVVKHVHKELGKKIPILTCQPVNWRDLTMEWINEHIPESDVKFVAKHEDKLEVLEETDMLIDDNPFYGGKQRVIMVDKPYNKACMNWKIQTKQQMEILIKLFYNFEMSIEEALWYSHVIAIMKGWWDKERSDGEVIALMHSELSECLEALRAVDIDQYNVAEEMVDCSIRIFDFCRQKNLPFSKVLREKTIKNLFRPPKHGKRF